ncbi:hypothetical protein Tco_0187772, partial [Tanacetum coccineum]
ATLKNELRKLKGKAVDKEAIETHSVDPNVSKDNMEPITPKLLNLRTAHSSYIKHTQEEALVLRDIVEHAISTGSPSSTTVDQDAPSPSNSHSTQETQTPIISHDVEEDNHDIQVAHMGNDPYFDIPIPEVISDQSSSVIIHTIVHPDHHVSEHNSKWTKDHPLENIIECS